MRPLLGEAIAQLVDARAAAGARATALADLLDGARALVDDGVHVTLGGRAAQADQHGFLILIMVFKSSSVKREPSILRTLVTVRSSLRQHRETLREYPA